MPHDWFGEEIAAEYDRDTPALADGDLMVDFLASLAADGSAVEFAIGTGRVALPLAGRGIHVSGLDLSAAMVARLRAKPGGGPDAIPVAIGDMATARIGEPGSFRLAYLVFNTITNLTTQEAQVDCFTNAARHLQPGGLFVVETFVPGLRWLPPGQKFMPFSVSDTHIGIDEYDIVNQLMISHHVHFRPTGAQRLSIPFRYAWPAEFDLMARLAGLRLRERWSTWARDPFTEDSESHISVWEKPNI